MIGGSSGQGGTVTCLYAAKLCILIFCPIPHTPIIFLMREILKISENVIIKQRVVSDQPCNTAPFSASKGTNDQEDLWSLLSSLNSILRSGFKA